MAIQVVLTQDVAFCACSKSEKTERRANNRTREDRARNRSHRPNIITAYGQSCSPQFPDCDEKNLRGVRTGLSLWMRSEKPHGGRHDSCCGAHNTSQRV